MVVRFVCPRILLDVADRHSSLVEPRPGLMTQIAELQPVRPAARGVLPRGPDRLHPSSSRVPEDVGVGPNSSPSGRAAASPESPAGESRSAPIRAVRVLDFSARIVISRLSRFTSCHCSDRISPADTPCPAGRDHRPQVRIRGVEQLLLVAPQPRTASRAGISLSSGIAGLGADLERAPLEVALADAPIQHLPQQLQVVIHGDG